MWTVGLILTWTRMQLKSSGALHTRPELTSLSLTLRVPVVLFSPEHMASCSLSELSTYVQQNREKKKVCLYFLFATRM